MTKTELKDRLEARFYPYKFKVIGKSPLKFFIVELGKSWTGVFYEYSTASRVMRFVKQEVDRLDKVKI